MKTLQGSILSNFHIYSSEQGLSLPAAYKEASSRLAASWRSSPCIGPNFAGEADLREMTMIDPGFVPAGFDDVWLVLMGAKRAGLRPLVIQGFADELDGVIGEDLGGGAEDEGLGSYCTESENGYGREAERMEPRNMGSGDTWGMSSSIAAGDEATGSRQSQGQEGMLFATADLMSAPQNETPKTVQEAWKCEECGKVIRGKRGNMNRHVANVHEKLRAFVCAEPGCGRTFQTQSNLSRHRKSLHIDKRHECPYCSRSFRTLQRLSRHVSVSHKSNNQMWACDVCGSCYGRRSERNRHRTTVHKQ